VVSHDEFEIKGIKFVVDDWTGGPVSTVVHGGLMKINNDGAGALTNTTDPLARTKTPEPAGGANHDAAGGKADALKLSPEAQMLQTLKEQSAGAPAIRQDVVDRMRALLDAGEVGKDVGRIAEALIDDLTDR
jgi:flagellar biosynthesis anti-sigma factor FlgM